MVAANPHYRFSFAGAKAVRPVNRLTERVAETNKCSTARPRLTAEDIRLHAWLTERLVALHYERHGLWPKLRRFLFGRKK